jgi:hypothetical protein
MSQKTAFFIVAAAKTSNLIQCFYLFLRTRLVVTILAHVTYKEHRYKPFCRWHLWALRTGFETSTAWLLLQASVTLILGSH